MKRAKVFEFNTTGMTMLLRGAIIADPPLPDDARVTDFHVDWRRDLVQFCVISNTYPEVLEGVTIPKEYYRLRRLLPNGTFEP